MAQDIKVEEVGGLTCEPTGGLAHLEVRVAPVEWFTSISKPKPICDDIPANEATTFEEMAEITADHVFGTGYGFMKLKGVQETIGLESTMIGEKRRRLFENKIAAVIAGSTSKLIGFSRWAKNKDFIVLVTEIESGRVRQIGSALYPASIAELAQKIDPTVEGDNSAAFGFSDKNVVAAPIYAGTVVDMPAQA